jgi:YafQ family addiction module toxin component
MRKFSIEEGLKKALEKLNKKDKVTYEILMRKIEEVITSKDINHYKNLRTPLHDFKRIHIRGPFILIFKYDESDDKIIFYEFNHHDYIYTR